ncbi:MAG: MFS transporter [Defluviitaleaceae bacterium]|nr:MFS transporter [Defluviitaleaceae bacterium]
MTIKQKGEKTMKNNSIWNKNFMTFVLALELHLIAKTLIRFALPLYVLIETGSPALQGMILSLSALPLIILSPIGGALTDKFNKKKILAIMNLLSAIVVSVYFLINPVNHIVVVILLIMMFVSMFESLISPTSEASIPSLVPADKLVKANSVTFLLTNISSIGAPVFGGIMLHTRGLTELLIIITALYILAAVINIFVIIPTPEKIDVQAENKGNLVAGLFENIKGGIIFVTKENRSIGKMIFVVFLLAITMITSMTITVPTLMVTYLEMPEHLIGLSQGVVVFGGTLAAILLPMLKGKHRTSKVILFIPSLTIVITGVLLLLGENPTTSYILLIACFFIVQIFLTMYGVIYFSFLGKKTPKQVMGKVMGLAISSSVLGFAIGDFLHGILFNVFATTPAIALIILGAISIIIALNAKIIEQG